MRRGIRLRVRCSAQRSLLPLATSIKVEAAVSSPSFCFRGLRSWFGKATKLLSLPIREQCVQVVAVYFSNCIENAMSVIATRPMDIWGQHVGPAHDFPMMQRRHFIDRLSNGSTKDISAPGASFQPNVLAFDSAMPAQQQKQQQCSPVMTPEGTSSLHSSPTSSPPETPVYGDAQALHNSGGLKAVKLPKVMDVSEVKVYRRKQATKREARRAVAIRKAFTSLEDCIPGHEERSFTRLEILEQAASYINDLTSALKQTEGGSSALQCAASKIVAQHRFQTPEDLNLGYASSTLPASAQETLANMSVRVDTPPAERSASSYPLSHASAAAAAASAAAAAAASAGAVGRNTSMLGSTTMQMNAAWQQPAAPLTHFSTAAQQPSSFPTTTTSAQVLANLQQHQATQRPLPICTFPNVSQASLPMVSDLTMLDIRDLFHSPEGALSEASSNWSDLMEEQLST